MKTSKSTVILALIVAVVLLYGVIYPNLYVLLASFQRDGVWSLVNYREVFSRRLILEATGSSIGVSLLTVLFCACIGVPLAFLFERYEFPGRRILSILAALPLVLPPLVGTIAFIFLCGESGILARLVQAAFQLRTPPWSLRGWGALLLFHTYTMYPFFYLLTGAGLSRIDSALSEAARSLGANRRQVLLRIVLPQLTPSLVAAALLTFMTSMASFSAPLLFGGNVRVLTLEIFSARQRGDVGGALTQTIILASISLVTLLFFQRYEGTRRFAAAAMKGSPRRRSAISSGQGRAIAGSFGFLLATFLALPVATLVLVSFAREGQWTTQTFPPAYTLQNYTDIFTQSRIQSAFLNSITMSGLAAVAAFAWSFCVTGLIRQWTGIRARIISLLVLIPWALPGTVVAVAITEAYGRKNLLTGSYILVGTFWILPLVYFLRFMPLTVRAVQANLEQMDPSLEEAAGSLGARWWQRLLRVRLPLVWPGAIAGTLLAFVFALGEYVASILVFVPGNRPISIAIASEMRDFNLGTAAALGVVLIIIVAASMGFASRLNRYSNA